MADVLYLDLVGGISGDMFLGALVDLGVSVDVLTERLRQLHFDGWHLHAEKAVVNGFSGTRVHVHIHHHEHEHHHECHEGHCRDHHEEHEHCHEHNHEHHHHEHRGFCEIRAMIEQSPLSPWVKQHAIAMFERVGKAEAKIHGKSLEEVHFHEVGAVDSIIDMVGACIGLELLGKPTVKASLPCDGHGFIECAHGAIPVPVPATLSVLASRGVAISQCAEETEMITPTGATILAEFVESFETMRQIVPERVGMSFGERVLKTRPNMLRAVLGKCAEKSVAEGLLQDEVVLLETNLDDTTPEVLGYVLERAMELGALDAWYTPIVMKKSRPAVTLSVLCKQGQEGLFTELIFRETGSIGIRNCPVKRFKLERRTAGAQLESANIPVKESFLGETCVHAKPEFDACAKLARETGKPLLEIIHLVQSQYEKR